ncbi:endonuclease VII domain-containing protein [Spirillospora sp. CA-142024]|uniref:endonuclease VII domain-containing protein n=1 Tax=Spirillospora sp. CA-142024 TaxID=3240036 RepID=UPI003D8AE5AD
MRSKKCRDCGEIKPSTDFWKLKSSKDGLAYYCKGCFGLRNSRSYRKKRANQGKETRAYRRHLDVPEGMKYCPQCKEIKSVDEFGRNRASRSGLTHYCRPCHNKVMAEIRDRRHGSARNYLLKHRYGLTEDQVNQMIADQGGMCVICLRAPAEHVDHDHVTGLVRRVLCFKCNGALGQFADDPERLRLAAEYLEFEGSQARRLILELGAPVFVGRRHLQEREWWMKARPANGSREQHRRRRYGINDADAEWLFKMQAGHCAVCFEFPAEHIDHDHATGAVRGIACGGCNSGMGQFGDDPISLRRAADYLLRELVKDIPARNRRTRLSFTVPDVDPRTVGVSGWESYREADGRHRRKMWVVGDDHEGPTWLTQCLARIQESYASMVEERMR